SAIRINENKGTQAPVLVRVDCLHRGCRKRGGVNGEPLEQPGRIVSRAMVVHRALFISFLTGESVSLLRKTTEACLSVRSELLAVGHRAVGIDHDVTAAKMIAELELNAGPPVLRMSITNTDERHTLFVIHNTDVIVLGRARLAAPAVMLKRRI